MLQFLQCKTFGNQAIPEGWLIVAAGNPPEYNKSVRDFDMVTLDRVRYLNIEADYKVWKEYARAKHLHNAILSYLELRQKNFSGKDIRDPVIIPVLAVQFKICCCILCHVLVLDKLTDF